ncbi:MAG: hypothetical protein AAFR37_07540 [Cyanobacteria bacterium J06628_3]
MDSSNIDVQISALNDALNYGDVGLDLVINNLENESSQINYLATRILKRHKNIKGKQALLKYNPKLSFIRLEDWEQQYYNPKIGIQNPIGTAYIVDCGNLTFLLQDPNVNQVEALICQMVASNDNYEEFITFREIISNASHKFTSLKAVFIGDNSVDESDYMKSFVSLGKVTQILNAYPQLELLHFRYGWDLQFKSIEHKSLKSLVIQTGLMFVDSVIPEICNLKLPELEYLELWLGGCYKYNEDVGTKQLLPILAEKLFPNLKYLALRSGDYSNNLAFRLTEFPTILEQLSILDLSMGTLTDKGAEALLNFPPVNKLQMLDVSMNNLSENMIQKLSELDCEVVAEPQDNEDLRYCTLYE